ncbi:uncharacterized protein KY384_004815 [Bacidia gigantensis]|uniref:uncharacterized protein n=1 Tax=Bacidia gigantensis TaxID=2732470 RepID=UPI001D045BD2|nr:uncharacterized protein KY384_004815 [Bacidia gigantensis]KAG8530313.1 hypothetical protein KY384_004815 [Bacidia gigantensis]
MPGTVNSVVIIHGLNGHAQRTFTHPETFVYWPQDILPEKVPSARVLTYGYNSSTKNLVEGQNVLDIALQLMVNLKDFRREKAEQHRDMLWICHSLGGIIAKKAILLHQSSDEGKAIRNSIVGIMFMGTPHCGSDLAKIGTVFANIASMAIEMPKFWLKTLSKNSAALYDISREFATVTSDLKLKLISFYELNPCSPPWWKGASVIVVDKRSAILGLPGEEIIAAHANHREICRFTGEDDHGFRAVWTRIDDFAKEAARKFHQREAISERCKTFNIKVRESLGKEGDVQADLIQTPISKSKDRVGRHKHWKVPFFPCASFTGRNALLQRILDYFMNHKSETQRRFAIYGLGGVGKTQLALTFAFQQRSKYSGVFFLDADSETTLHEDFSKIHDDLDLGCPKDKIGAVKRWFDMEDDVNWLLIFDNADELESYQLTDYFPLSKETHIILTSRDPNAAELTSEGLLLEMMEPEESKALLISRATLSNLSAKDLRDVDHIVEELSHLPLAIDQAGAYIRTRKCSPAAYIRLFESQRERILKFSPKLSSYNKSVITSWEVSFQRLEADMKVAAEVFLVFCYLDSKRISEELLTGVASPVLKMDEDGNEQDTIAEDNGVQGDLVDLMTNEDDFDSVIEKMLSLSLIQQYTESTGNKDVQFGRLTRSHLDRCFHYVDKPLEFGDDLSKVAKKLLLIIYSIRTIQMFGLKIVTTESDRRLLKIADSLLQKHADPYLDIMGVFVRTRQLIKDHPDQPEKVEMLLEEYFQRSGTTSGIDLNNPGQKGRFNAALGDLRNFRASIRQRLNRNDSPDMLLQDWSPVIVGHPSTLERNAKWWIDRNVGTYLVEESRYDDAEQLLLGHVSEFAKCDMEGTDEHLAGADRLARLYYVKRDWPKARDAIQRPVEIAKSIGREIGSWHVLHSKVVLQEILVNGGWFVDAECLIDDLTPILKEMALPDVTAGPLFVGMCLKAQIAHVREDWTTATELWRHALTLGRSVGWPEEVGLALPICSLDALGWEVGKEARDEASLAEWKRRLFARRMEAGKEEDFLDGFGEAWKEELVKRVERLR